MKQVGIIGFGRFGKVLTAILQKGFDVVAFDPELQLEVDNVYFSSLHNVIQSETIFLCVPFRTFKNVII